MTKSERDLQDQLDEQSRRLKAMIEQAAELQGRVRELELAMTRIFKEALKYVR